MAGGGINRGGPASQAELKTRLRLYLKRAENKSCADCNEKRPIWASILIPPPHAPCADGLMVAFICFTCAEAHRKCVGAGCVKNVNSDTWSDDEVFAAKSSGNLKVNEIFEAAIFADLPSTEMIKPSESADISFRERFAREKYVEGRYFPGQKVAIIQQPQSSIPSPPLESPKKRGGVLKKFLKKEQRQQQNDPFQSPPRPTATKVKKSSDCSATADMTLTPTICSDTKSIASFTQMMSKDNGINNSNHTNLTSPSCPQVEITTLKPPTLDEKEWEKVASPRNGTSSSTMKSGGGGMDGSYTSIFDSAGPHMDTISGKNGGSPRQSPRSSIQPQEGSSQQLNKSWWNLEGEKGLTQTLRDAAPVIPPSPRKSPSFSKFLKKQLSANSSKSRKSPVGRHKSMTQLPTVTIDDDGCLDIMQNKFGASSSSGLSCPQVQITIKPPPTLDDDEWERITRGGGGGTSSTRCNGVQSERNGRSVFDAMPNQQEQEHQQISNARPRRNRSSFTSADSNAVAIQANAKGRPKRNRSSPNVLGDMQRFHKAENEFDHQNGYQNNELKTPAFAFRKPQHAIDPNREAFQKSRSGGLDFSSNASCDLLLLDDEADEGANNNERTQERDHDESSSAHRGGFAATTSSTVAPSTPTTRSNSRVNLYSSKRRGRSSSRTRIETNNNGSRRPRSESRTKGGERTTNEKESSSSRRDHRGARSSSRRRSSSRQIARRDEDRNVEPQNSRRERSTSRQRRRSSTSNPDDNMIPDFIDLTDEAEEEKSPRSEKRKDSKRDVLRSRSPSQNRKSENDADHLLQAYRKGTESPKRRRSSSNSRVRSGKESPLRDGGRRGRSRSSSRRRSSSRTISDRVGSTREGDRPSRRRSSSRRREGSDRIISKRPSVSKKVAAQGSSSNERRSRSKSRTRREEEADVPAKPRRSRSTRPVDDVERRDIVDEVVLTAASFEKYIESVSATTTDESEHSTGDHRRAAEKSFRVIADASLGDMSGFLADANSDSESFRKPYRRKKGGEEYIKERRRSGRTHLKSKNAERESRKTGIFASLDREEDAVKTNVGPLMSRMTNMAGDTPLTQLRDEFSGPRPLAMKGHVSARDLGVTGIKARAAMSRMNESSPDLAPVDSIIF